MCELSNWKQLSANYEIDGQISLLATIIFNSECPDDKRRFIKKRVVINELKKMIKKILLGSTRNIEMKICNLLYFAANLENCNTINIYKSDKIGQIEKILFDMRFVGF